MMETFDMTGSTTNPDVDRKSEVYGWSSVMLVLSTLAVVLRFISRRSVKSLYKWDDWSILLALPFSLATCILPIVSTREHNLGRPISTSTEDQIRHYLLLAWLYDLCYMIALGATKFSIILLYWRMFPIWSYKIPLYILGATTLGLTIGSIFAVIFTCDPVSAVWNMDSNPRCFNSLRFYVGQGATNIFIDIALLIFLAFLISRLHTRLSQKIVVTAVFLLGAFITICTILRLQQLIKTSQNTISDPTIDLIPVTIWSTVEVNLSVVAACLPTSYTLFHHFRSRANAADIQDYDDVQALGHITVRDEIEIETHPRGSWGEDVRLGVPSLAYHPGGINSSEVSVEKEFWSGRKVSIESGERR